LLWSRNRHIISIYEDSEDVKILSFDVDRINKRIAYCTSIGDVKISNVLRSSPELTASTSVMDSPTAVKFEPQSNGHLFVGTRSGALYSWDYSNNTHSLIQKPNQYAITSIASKDNCLLTGSREGTIVFKKWSSSNYTLAPDHMSVYKMPTASLDVKQVSFNDKGQALSLNGNELKQWLTTIDSLYAQLKRQIIQ